MEPFNIDRHPPFALPEPARELDALAERADEWSKDLEAWGPSDGNRFEIWHANDQIESICVRIDLRGSIRTFVKGVLAFAQRHDLALYDQERGAFLGPTPSELASAIESSSAFRFVSDPEAFLKALPRSAV